tara:strand:+ start:421 stop:612 length:192 start_codon:yes stop_codon:yes gene_type:complete
VVTENTGEHMISEEQFEWMITIGGMQQDGLKWDEAFHLCKDTMKMPEDVANWLIERKKFKEAS